MTNTGTAQAGTVSPTAYPGLSGTANALVAISSSFNVVTLAAGTSASFTYTFSAQSVGTVTLTSTAHGNDVNSLQGLTSNAASSPLISIFQPSSLAASIAVSPVAVKQGDTLTMVMTVNDLAGSSGALNVQPSAPTVSPADATLLTGPVPSLPQPIPSGSSTSFTWTFSAITNSPNPISFAASATGFDANSGLAVTSPYVTGTAQISSSTPVLAANWQTLIPVTATVGQQVTAILTISNTNLLVAATNVSVSSYGVNTALPATNIGGVQPLVVPNLAGGGSTSFTFRYSFGGAGTAVFTATAMAGPGAISVSNSSSAVLVQTPPALSTTAVSLSPNPVSVGQLITLGP